MIIDRILPPYPWEQLMILQGNEQRNSITKYQNQNLKRQKDVVFSIYQTIQTFTRLNSQNNISKLNAAIEEQTTLSLSLQSSEN